MSIKSTSVLLAVLCASRAVALDPVTFLEQEIVRHRSALEAFQPTQEDDDVYRRNALEGMLRTTERLLVRAKRSIEDAKARYRPESWPVPGPPRDLVLTGTWLGERRLATDRSHFARYGALGMTFYLLPIEGELKQVKHIGTFGAYVHASAADARADLLQAAGRYLPNMDFEAGDAGFCGANRTGCSFVRDNILVQLQGLGPMATAELGKEIDRLIQGSPVAAAGQPARIVLADDIGDRLVDWPLPKW